MRDLTSSWPAVPAWDTAVLDHGGLRAVTVVPASQHLVSGNLSAFAEAAGLPNEGVGAFGEASGELYALRVARDRILVVNASGNAVTGGWHHEGYAVTDVSAAYHVFDFSGEGVPLLVEEAMFIDPLLASPSAATTFAGQQAIVYRHDGSLRVHVERGFAPYIWQWLEARD